MEDVDTFLTHYGIAGMHWGIRKEKETSSVKKSNKELMSPKTKDFLKKVAIGAAVVAAGTALYGTYKYADIKITSAIFNGPKTFIKNGGLKDVTLPSFVKFHRMTDGVETGIKDRAFAVYKPKDIFTYRSAWAKTRRTILGLGGKTKIASHDSAVKALSEIMNDPKKKQKFFNEAKMFDPIERAIFNSMRGEDAARAIYAKNTRDIWSGPMSKATTRVLQKKGYNATTDIWDSGRVADHSVVLFDKRFKGVSKTYDMKKAKSSKTIAKKLGSKSIWLRDGDSLSNFVIDRVTSNLPKDK